MGRSTWLGLALTIALLAGGGTAATSQPHPSGGAASATATQPAHTTVTATAGGATISATKIDVATATSACGQSFTAIPTSFQQVRWNIPGFWRVGALIAGPMTPNRLSYPLARASDGHPVNPGIQFAGGDFSLPICNPAGQTHTYTLTTLTVATFTAVTGMVATQNPCGGCGSGTGPVDAFLATWPVTITPGVPVPLAKTNDSATVFPKTIEPNSMDSVDVLMTTPMPPGSYTFAAALQVDGGVSPNAILSCDVLFLPPSQLTNG